MADQTTLQFYADHAAEYAERTRHEPRVELDAFLDALPPLGSILELGTGSGRDAAHMLSRGFVVTASDASPELAAEAERLIRQNVRLMAFNQLEDIALYDGIWACAALLHAPSQELTGDLTRIHRALRPNGRLVASFKAGTGEGRDGLGRYYNYPSAETLLNHLAASADWASVALTAVDGGGYDGVPTRWLWVTAIK